MTPQPPQNKLALLIAGPQSGDEAMLNDQFAMQHALLARGFPSDCIHTLHGQLDRPLLLSFLHNARRRMNGWSEGSLFIHYGGHGFFHGETVESARPGMLFDHADAPLEDVTDDFHLFWNDFFDALDLPDNVHLTLLPDL